MQAVIDDWKVSKVTLVTSALTITEVLYVKLDQVDARVQIDRSQEEQLRALFLPRPNQYLTIVELDRWLAISARELVWDYNIKPKDAIHVASALHARVPVLHTTDKRLTRHSGKLGGDPVLRIETPSWVRQMTLDDQEGGN